MPRTINIDIESLSVYFTTEWREQKATAFLLKALMLVALVRVIRFWMVADIFFEHNHPATPGSLIGKMLLLPSVLAQTNQLAFFIVVVTFLVLSLFLKPDYRINILFFWVVLNLFILQYPIVNGADYVLLIFSMLGIPLATKPEIKWHYGQITAVAMFNTFRVLAQIQVLLIYQLSGIDKLKSELWRSGKAFEYVAHLDVIFNPLFSSLLEYNAVNLFLSWSTILFEITFVFLVYIKRTRLLILCVGVFFHIIIWLMLGLPDFAWVMIATYGIFLKDEDLDAFKKRFTLLPQ